MTDMTLWSLAPAHFHFAGSLCIGAFSQQLQVVAANLITVEPAESSKSSMYYNLQFLKQNLADVVIQVERWN